ncbi:MAG: hypothetical protein AAF078_00015 [Planctomycetota bacterium]
MSRVWRIRPWAASIWVALACVVWLVFAGMHALGWRDSLSLLSGTLPDAGPSTGAAMAALAYGAAYLLSVSLAPILLIAAMLRFFAGWLVDRRPSRARSAGP